MPPKLPPPLNPGDTIGVMAPSSRIAKEDIDASKRFLEARNYRVHIHPQTRLYAGTQPLNQYAGSAEQKVNALHDLAQDKNINAIFFATGGQRSLTLLDKIDYELITKNPKIYMGFSDNTALLNAISAKTGLVTYHGPTFKRAIRNPQIDFNLTLLAGEKNSIPLQGSTVFRSGRTNGVLFGGNLAIVRSLMDGDMPPAQNGILFLEEFAEELTTVDRDLCALKRRGMLGKIGGLILGQFSNMRDTGTPFGFSFEDIITEHTAGLDIPILMNAPFGHAEDLYALPIGMRVSLQASDTDKSLQLL